MATADPSDGQPVTTEAPVTGAGDPPNTPGVADAPRLADAPADAQPAPNAPQVCAAGSRGARPVPVTVWRRVDSQLEAAFDAVVPIPLEQVFTGFGPLPAVVGTDELAGPWGAAVGQSRTVRLAGGGRLRETILEVGRPGLFRYEVVPTHGALRLIVRRIEGRFIFSPSEAGGTVIRWTYVFRPRRGARPAVRALAPIWRRYADQVMERLARAVAASAPRSGTDAAAG